MSQNLTFKNAIQRLYYDVDVKEASYDSILRNFSNISNKYSVRTGSAKLLDNIDMGIDGHLEKKSHIFTFIKSPFNQLKIDSGEITINIGEAQKVKKILSVDWCFYFLKQEDAEIFFDYLTTIFTPVSSKQKFEKDKIDLSQYAEFTSNVLNEKGIKDITFTLGKSMVTRKYEIRLFPYNEFTE